MILRGLASAIVSLFVFAFAVSSTALAESPGKWSTGAPMLSARSEVAVAVVAGKVYVAGGFGGGVTLEIYDPATNRWRHGAPVPRAVHHAAAVEMGGRLYVIGGYAGGWAGFTFWAAPGHAAGTAPRTRYSFRT